MVSKNAAQSEIVKEKVRNTCQEKYGVNSYLSTDECKLATKKYCNEHGVEYISQIPEIKVKVKNTLWEKYGVTCSVAIPEVKEAIKETCRKKYGSDYYISSAEGKEKRKDAMLKKYGVDHFFENKRIPYKNQRYVN